MNLNITFSEAGIKLEGISSLSKGNAYYIFDAAAREINWLTIRE